MFRRLCHIQVPVPNLGLNLVLHKFQVHAARSSRQTQNRGTAEHVTSSRAVSQGRAVLGSRPVLAMTWLGACGAQQLPPPPLEDGELSCNLGVDCGDRGGAAGTNCPASARVWVALPSGGPASDLGASSETPSTDPGRGGTRRCSPLLAQGHGPAWRGREMV